MVKYSKKEKGAFFMSFTLLFYNKKNKKVAFEDILTYFQTKSNFTSKLLDKDHNIFIYKNDLTGVYFAFSYEINNEVIEKLTDVDDYSYSGFSFILDFFRPSFFALEAIPYVIEFCQKYELLIFNPHIDNQNFEEQLDIKLDNYHKDQLITSYIKTNDETIISFKEQSYLSSIKREKSLYTYNYLKEIANIESIVDDDFVIPKIEFIRNNDDETIHSMISWYQACPIIIPKCDFILLFRENKTFFGLVKKQIPTFIKYEDVIKAFSDLLKPFSYKINDLYQLPKEFEDQALEILYTLPQIGHNGFVEINTDEFIDEI